MTFSFFQNIQSYETGQLILAIDVNGNIRALSLVLWEQSTNQFPRVDVQIGFTHEIIDQI
jgi:hypothetical protein